MKKDLKDIQQHKAWLMQGMSSVPLDSAEYAKMNQQYKLLCDAEDVIKKGKKSPFDAIYKVLTLLVSIAGAVFVPLSLGQLAYKNEQDMSLKNGTVWNLIGRTFGPKGKE